MKTKYPHIQSVLVLPYLDRKVDAGIYDYTTYPPLERVPRRYAISHRNRWLEDQSDVVIAYVLHSWGGAASTLEYAQKKNKTIRRYLDYLTAEKKFSPATRNNRLAAIRAFVSYASACYLECIALESELSAIKVQKDDPFSKVDYMTENAVTALLNEPDVKTKIGLRDRFLMIFLYDSGARISEALGVRLCDIKLDNSPQVLLFGKGNKVRAVPLMEKTVEHLKQYMYAFHKEESLTSTVTLFYVLHKGKKEPMNDETVRVRLQKYADAARKKCSEVPQKVHPHLWRHTRAMHLYQHGMDLALVSQWLGHANLSTSLVYAYADTEHKRDAIEKAMGGEHSGITDTTLCTVDDDELLKKLYGL